MAPRHMALRALAHCPGGSLALALALAATPALAQYKVIGPDGTVTYTDQPQSREQIRPPEPPAGKASTPGQSAGGPAPAPPRASGDTRHLSNRNVLGSPGAAGSAGSAGTDPRPVDSKAPQGVAGRARASELIQAINSNQPLNNGLTPAQMRAIITSDASTNDLATGAAGRALVRLPPATSTPSTLGQDRLAALAAVGALASTASGPPALLQAASQRPVVLFANPACSACSDWLAALAQRGVPAAVFSVTSPGDFAQLQRLSGQTALPVLALGGQVVATAETPLAIGLKALEQAGYPAAAAKATSPAAAKPLADSSSAAATLMRVGPAGLMGTAQ